MSTELPTAGRSRLVASDRTVQPWTTLVPDSSRLLHSYRFRLPSAIRPNKVPPSRCQGWRSLTRPRVEEFEVATGGLLGIFWFLAKSAIPTGALGELQWAAPSSGLSVAVFSFS